MKANVSSGGEEETNKLTGPEPFTFRIFVSLDEIPGVGCTADEEILTIGDHGEMISRISRSNTRAGADQLRVSNQNEYERCRRMLAVWEERLRNSPLDTKLQDFVAFHQDVVRRIKLRLEG